MRFLQLLFSFLAVLLGALAADNGLQTVVEWDNGSLQIDGERVIIMSGEFHYARLPVPEVRLMVTDLLSTSDLCNSYGSTSSRNSERMA